MSRLWAWWMARVERTEDARILASVRVAASLAVVLDLLRVWQLGLVPVLFRTYADGGLSSNQDTAYLVDRFLGSDVAGPLLFWTSLVCFALVALGVLSRPATVVGVLAYAQLGHLYTPGDRAIDRVLRNVLLLLLFSDAHRRFALGGGPRLEQIRSWPTDLVKTLMVCVYMSAGITKVMQQPGWLGLHGTPVLYRVMTDPMAAHVDAVAAQGWFWPLRLLGWGTILMECTGFLIYTPLAPLWAVPGALMHLGIASTMELGMFSWGMLSLYPVLVGPWLLPRLDRLRGRP